MKIFTCKDRLEDIMTCIYAVSYTHLQSRGINVVKTFSKLDLKDMILNQCTSISTENVARQKLIVW